MALSRKRRPVSRPNVAAMGAGVIAFDGTRRAVSGLEETAQRLTERIARIEDPTPGDARETIDPRDFGAKFDGSTDDTEAIQRALDEAQLGRQAGLTVRLPTGKALWSKTLHVRSIGGLRVLGDWSLATRLHWIGAAGEPGFKYDGTTNCSLENVRLTIEAGHVLSTGIEVGKDIGNQASSQHVIRHVQLVGQTRLGIGVHYRLYQPDFSDDLKNDHHAIYHSQIQAYTDAGIVLEGYNAKKLYFEKILVQGRTTGQYGIDTARVPGHGGSFEIRGGQVSENQQWDFRLGKPNDPIIIDGVFSQSSVRYLQILNDEGGYQPCRFWPVTIRGARFGTRASKLPADSVVIDIKTCGPVSFVDGFKLGGNSAAGTYKVRYRPQQIAGQATATLAVTAQLADGDTITIGSVTYTMRSGLVDGGLQNEILIGPTVNLTIDHLVDAINSGAFGDPEDQGDDGAGEDYGEGTIPHPQVSATRDAQTLVVKALVAGAAGNSIGVSETALNASWDGVTLVGGVDAAFENSRGSLAFENCVISSSNANGDFWTELPPDSVRGSIHHNQLGEVEPILLGYEAIEAGYFMPRRDEDWMERGLPVPRVWHDAAETNGHGTGNALDRQRRHKVLDLKPQNKELADYGQVLTPWTRPSIAFQGDAGESMTLEDNDGLLQTTTGNIAMGILGLFGQPSTSTRILLVFGNAATGAGQGPFVRQQSDGTLRLVCDGNSVNGVYNYNDSAIHPLIGIIDHGSAALGLAARLLVVTDKEVLNYVAAFGFPTTVGTTQNKGLGTTSVGSSAGKFSWRLFFAWHGADVRRIRVVGTPGAWNVDDIIPQFAA